MKKQDKKINVNKLVSTKWNYNINAVTRRWLVGIVDGISLSVSREGLI